MTVSVLLLLTMIPQEASRSESLRVSGEIDLQWVLREREVNEAAFTLNTEANPFAAAPPTDSVDFFHGRVTLRFDGRATEDVAYRLELETPFVRGGTNLPFGVTRKKDMRVEQGYVEVHFDEEFMLRAGIQDLRIQNRPIGIGEPFFLDLTESEPFFSGVTFPPPASAAPPALTTAVRNTTARAVLNPVGVRLRYDPNPFIMAEAFALNIREAPGGLPLHQSEYVVGLHASAALGEFVSVFLLGTFHSGPFHGSRVWTVGPGVDAYLDDPRTLEIFAEAYGQFGSLIDEAGIDIEKEGAWAATAGVRKTFDGFWIEGAYEFRTGDQDASDSKDNAFQSYEGSDRFLVLESDEFGLDFDMNTRAVKLAAGFGLGPGLLAPGDLAGRIDVGWFQLDEPLVGVFGTTLTRRDDLGIEVDATLVWQAYDQLDFRLRSGWLLSSRVLKSITPSAQEDTYIVTAGFFLRF